MQQLITEAVGTETTELSSATDVADYINAAKEAFYNALDEAQRQLTTRL